MLHKDNNSAQFIYSDFCSEFSITQQKEISATARTDCEGIRKMVYKIYLLLYLNSLSFITEMSKE